MAMTQNGTVNLTVKRTAYAVTGDKFTTPHGQKGVVTIVDDSLMPVLLDCDTGFVPEMVMGSTSILKRSTPGQLLEAIVSYSVMLGVRTDVLWCYIKSTHDFATSDETGSRRI